MEQAQYNSLFSFILNIATGVLVYAFDKIEIDAWRLISDVVTGQLCVTK